MLSLERGVINSLSRSCCENLFHGRFGLSLARLGASKTTSRAQLPLRTNFSTMTSLRFTPVPSAIPREYDPEIKDIANYVHKYKIDSDLAVSSDPS
jgi:hypothetical protein